MRPIAAACVLALLATALLAAPGAHAGECCGPSWLHDGVEGLVEEAEHQAEDAMPCVTTEPVGVSTECY